jgi:hypothetical protein
MKKHLLTAIAALALMVALPSTKAAAQMPNMDMSWGIQSQMALQAWGNTTAHNMAMTYLLYMQRLRQMGYTGPSIDVGINANTLQQSMRRLQNSYDAYNRASAANSIRRDNAINNWDYRVLRGCEVVTDYNGNRYWSCPSY